ncbi:MAG: isoleucine--tRNA ligase [Candidatus Alcyoniella australis]|nr:isoleucine--tRNA ligase [Candidatus Alcyoniella australis]
MNYKDTLNLPKTKFPMRANLSQREPEFLARWYEMRLYQQLLQARADAPDYILHDGPPYANGNIHLGTALNKILKDIIVKSRAMAGFRAPYVPGWDCHGLPIEHQVDKELGAAKEQMSAADVRKRCRSYAAKFVDIQREEFKRLGGLGDWDNPYLTMDYGYEATIAREFGRFVAAGSLYKGRKPVYWCAHCVTALAEAEVEYADHLTPSITVAFKVVSDLSQAVPELAGRDNVHIAIWTTTPWTLPANLALAFHPDYDYVAIECGERIYIMAERLAALVFDEAGLSAGKTLARFPGSAMEGQKARHPFIQRESLVINADYVTLDTGTGIVHIAPGHGQEDYESGLAYGLDVYAPVDDQGRFTKDVDFFAGQFVFDANGAVIEKLQELGMLLAQKDQQHSYPHCWRCKQPIIFRATSQWFISMEHAELRAKSLEQIERTRWIPSWGKDRIYGMVANRPDWCLSRQRSWGIPILAFTCKGCESTILDAKVVQHVAELFAREGSDAWFIYDPPALVPAGFVCPECGAGPEQFVKERDILDVWFDSGVSYAAVCERRDDLRSPVDLYIEGSDQHRGWFHSSLLASVGTRGCAPYATVLTHGFVVDGNGKKMSKSLGNVIQPEQVIKRYGAEILRLWTAAEDYRDDIRISDEILKRLVEAYRRIRNTFRFMLGNLQDFDPELHAVPIEQMTDIDRWALQRLGVLIEQVRGWYEQFEFHRIFHALHNYCVVDLSSLYLDVLKDRLYAEQREGELRRGSQTVLWTIAHSLVRLVAPILSFTAEEVWDHLAHAAGDPESVHLALLPDVDPAWADPELTERWQKLLELRALATKALELGRNEKLFGNSVDAKVTMHAPGALGELLEQAKPMLPELLIVSEVELAAQPVESPTAQDEALGASVRVEPSDLTKCPRCWLHKADIGSSPEHPELCARCAAAV